MTRQFLLAREARILGIRLKFGLVELEEIERWADAALLAMTDAPYELVELAMARSAGVKETLGLLTAIGGDVTEPADVILAAAAADPDRLNPREWERLLGDVANWTYCFNGPSTPQLALLFGAFGPSDDLTLALHESGVTIENAMLRARAYFRQIVDMAAKFREQAGGNA